MAAKAQAGVRPTMTDAGIAAKTGHGWDYWFAALDEAGAAKLDHGAIAALLEGGSRPAVVGTDDRGVL